jgi:aminopeptidase-like protein
MNRFVLTCFFFVWITFVWSQEQLVQDICAHIDVLASDEMKGRSTGSLQEKEANCYVEKEWGKSKKTKTLHWSYKVQLDDSTMKSEMIGNFVNNEKDSTILIGAHIDHIGYGGKLSKSLSSNEIHNGADDNASGVALLIEVQKSIAELSLNYNVLFVAYSGHEIGTFGSKYLSQHLPRKASKLALVINYDMVGRMNEQNDVYLSITPSIENYFHTNSKELNIKIGDESKLEVLDTKYFYPRIPCVTLTTGMHNDYHKSTDDVEYINCEGIARIHEFTLTVLKQL